MTAQEKDRIECAIRHIKTAVDVDPWAAEIAVDAMRVQLVKENQDFSQGLVKDCISRQAAKEAYCKKFCHPGVLCPDSGFCREVDEAFDPVPSAQPEWNNHTVACMLAELFDDTCACNYNGIDEWLPEKCEVIDACPNPVGVACWEQYLTHRFCHGCGAKMNGGNM